MIYEYRATVLSVRDGDSITVDVDLGWNVWRRKEPLRLAGIDAPELGTAAGTESRDYLRTLLPAGTEVTITTQKDREEKYGRMLAVVHLGTDDTVNEALMRTGHARPWNGKGPRP